MIRFLLGLRAFAASSVCLRFAVPCAVVAWTLCGALTTQAENRFWVTGAGGAFNSASNWSLAAAGASGATPPAAGDIANFTLAPTYTVAFGGSLSNLGLQVANGNVTLDLNTFTYTITDPAVIGIGTTANQTGRLTIRDGILAVDTAGDDLLIGTAAGATGFLTVTTGGRLGNGTFDPDVVVGSGGTATLAIEDDGRADMALLNIAQGEGSTGTVSVTGPNAVLDASGAVNVGTSGNATLNLVNGGTLSSAGVATVGNLVGANGNVAISGGTASWLQGGAFVLADAGDGALSIQSAGFMSTAGNATIGNLATGVGAAIVTGPESTWNMAGNLTVASSGLGNFAISNGGQATTSAATTIGGNVGSEGNAVVSGAGSRWTTGAMTVGSGGKANLSVSTGGLINTAGNVTIANSAASTAKASVSGAGSIWNITGTMTVAGAGAGTLTIENGGFLSTTSALTLNDPAGGPNGTLNFQGGTIIAGGFTRSATSTLNWTDGTFVVNGGTLNNGGANLTVNGGDADDTPALRLSSGATSTAASLPNLTIASNRQGAVIVSGGSSFATTTTSIGGQDGSNGTLLVEGVNSTLSASGDLNVGGTTVAAGGIGNASIGIGGTVSTAGTLRLWNGANVNVNGGTLAFANLAPNGGRVNLNSGTVQVTANLNANAAVLNALLGAPRTLGLGRRIELPTSTLNLQSDLNVSGGALAGNVLAISSGVITRVSTAGTVAFTSGITNPAGARMYVADSSVAAGGTLTNGGELHLDGQASTVSATTLANTGLLRGSGRINNVVTNSAAGQIRVADGERLEILGSSGNTVNDGLIDVDGGTLEFGRTVVNSSANPSTGLIAARDAKLHFQSGLLNSGSLTFTAGVSDVFGDVTVQNNLLTPGRIVVTGGAAANFFDDVINNGSIQVSASGNLQSTAVFLGSFSGNGVAGTGHVFLEGDTRPGFSPGTMAFGGNVSFGQLAALEIELAGATPGTQFDRVTVADQAVLAGTLEVSLLGGYKPAAGSSFQILSATGGIIGTFSNEVLPTLAGGLSWDVGYAAQSVSLTVGGILGDYNLNGSVDAADYVAWRNLLGSNNAAADGSGNGIVDQADYNVWRANFGKVAAAAAAGLGAQTAAAVPEPSTAILAGFVAMIIVVARSKRDCDGHRLAALVAIGEGSER